MRVLLCPGGCRLQPSVSYYTVCRCVVWSLTSHARKHTFRDEVPGVSTCGRLHVPGCVAPSRDCPHSQWQAR